MCFGSDWGCRSIRDALVAGVLSSLEHAAVWMLAVSGEATLVRQRQKNALQASASLVIADLHACACALMLLSEPWE